ncbi:MAG: ABC transporter ATP-binding protein, partial [Firmicutes bacterium]|nr:ABC transporter ATP-binding protein [Bacillota bacterium]
MNRKPVLLRLAKYLLRYKFLLFGAFALTIGSNLLGLVGPKLSGFAIDAIGTEAGKVDFDSVFYYCGLMVAFYLASALLSYLLSVLMIYISRKVVYQMRSDIFNKLMSLPVGFFDNNQTGDLLSRISYDTDTINTSLSHDLVQILASAITITGAFVMMLTISPVLVLVF